MLRVDHNLHVLVKGGAIVKESYFALKQRQQREVNALPIHFAFGRTQIDEKLRELGVKCPEKELVSVGAGGFCLKSDAKYIAETFVRHARERREAMADDAFAEDAFYTEASNHEYGYAMDPDYDMALCFGYPFKHGRILWEKVPDGERLAKCYHNGIARYRKWFNEHC